MLLEVIGFDRRAYELSVSSMIYLSAATVFTLYAFFNYRDRRGLVIYNVDNTTKSIVDGVLALCNIGSIMFFLPFAVDALTGDINTNRIDLETTTSGLLEAGLVNTFFSAIAASFGVSLVLGFANIANLAGRSRRSYYMGWVLILSSLCYVVYILAWVGRDGFVYWIMLFVFVYYVFKPALAEREKSRIRKAGFVLFVLLLPSFVIISIARFSERDLSVLVWLIVYAGEQVNNFNDYFLVYSDDFSQHGLATFRLVNRFIGADSFDNQKWFDYYLSKQVMPWKFSTFIGSFLKDMGPFTTGLLLGIFFIFVRLVKISERSSVSTVILFVILAQVPLFGLFYFRQADSNAAILLSLLIAAALRVRLVRNRR